MNLYTEVKFRKEAREKLVKGIDIMADAVGSTLGARGRNVAIETATPAGDTYDRKVIHDGVGVARSIELPDHFENMGAALIREASQKQVDEVGDGTTVVMILARAIVKECIQMVDAGINPMSLRRGLETRVKELVTQLEAISAPIKGIDDLNFIATISSEDEFLGKLVADTLFKLGKDGVITAEMSKNADTTVEHQEGMQLEKGWYDPYFMTNDRGEAVIENAYILVTDKPITSLFPLTKFFEAFIKQSSSLVIISPEISPEPLQMLATNKRVGKLNILPIQAPSFGEDQKNILQDIAVLTGGTLIAEGAGFRFEDVTPAHLGFAASVKADMSATIISGGKGTKESIASRVESIKANLENTESEFDKQRMRARLGKLTSGVAVIRVGGQTEVEMKERRERVLDAIAATKAAMEKGIVPGGEIVFLHIRKYLKDSQELVDKILYAALYEPFKKLIQNAGLDEVDLAVQLEGKDNNTGVDVTTGEVKDMVAAGIVDPVLVPIHALQNALSVAVQIITTNCVVVPIDPIKK